MLVTLSMFLVNFMMCCFFSREFGAKVINLKTLMKALPSLFEHSDKNVRAEVYMYTYMIHAAFYKIIRF